ncbi:MAG: 3-hydroxyacyl-ACP dehydratase FabZ [Defluviitaleaceae bacterium]|nr:3-hydroxyacyl-ACP dehydratase FabZ [Defluviitaleaceae bacterium]
MNIQEILNTLPHRYPFLLVDKVVEITEDGKTVAIKNVTINEPFFVGHFPEEPVMPGVLIIEAIAQTGALYILSKDEFKGRIAYLVGVDGAKFRGKVVPGDVLRLEVEITKLKKSAGIGQGIAFVGDKKVAECKITFMIGDAPKAEE